MNYCWFLGSFLDTTHYYNLNCVKSITNVPTKYAHVYDFGFDLYPTSVEEIHNIEDVHIYPNPAREKCSISFGVKKQMESYNLVLKDISGREVKR